MKEDPFILDLIPYNEMATILWDKFNATSKELRYWIKKSLDETKLISHPMHTEQESNGIMEILEKALIDYPSFLLPYASDLPFMNAYELPPDGFFYPECYFYDKKSILKFVPSPYQRFVYQKDLTAHRNWNDYKTDRKNSILSLTLTRANEYGILRFYDQTLDEFTTHANKSTLWCHTFDGESYVSNPDSVFLLPEILNVERIFFGKLRKLCLEELGIKYSCAPSNVINIKNKNPI